MYIYIYIYMHTHVQPRETLRAQDHVHDAILLVGGRRRRQREARGLHRHWRFLDVFLYVCVGLLYACVFVLVRMLYIRL